MATLDRAFLRASKSRATLPGRVDSIFQPARLHCAKCRRENICRSQTRWAKMHSLPLSVDKQMGEVCISMQESVENVPMIRPTHCRRTSEAFSNNNGRIIKIARRRSTKTKPGNAVTSTTDISKVAKIVNSSDVINSRRVSAGGESFVRARRENSAHLIKSAELRRTGAFRLGRNSHRPISGVTEVGNRRHSVAVLRKESPTSDKMNNLVRAIHTRRSSGLAISVKWNEIPTSRIREDSYEERSMFCRQNHGCSRICGDCANDIIQRYPILDQEVTSVVDERLNKNISGLKEKETKNMGLHTMFSTPPPAQYRNINRFDIDESCSPKYQRMDENYIPVASEAVMELLKSRRRFGSTLSVCASKKVKGKGFLSAVTKSRLWRKPRARKSVSGRLISDNNVVSSPNVQKTKAITKSQNLTKRRTQEPTKTTFSPHPCKINDKLNLKSVQKKEDEISILSAERLWEEFAEITNSGQDEPQLSKQVLGFKMRSSDNAIRYSGRWRRNSLPHTPTRTFEKKYSSGEGLNLDKLSEMNNLRSFLSIKLFAWSFRTFLESEFSEENLDFWLECEAYKYQKLSRQTKTATKIFAKYLATDALREVNVDVQIRKNIEAKLDSPDSSIFHEAQSHIYDLMNKDSYRRFQESDVYQKMKLATESRKKKIKMAKISQKRNFESDSSATTTKKIKTTEN
ncbi:uncharacterized protein LOC120344126 [Styela clava]